MGNSSTDKKCLLCGERGIITITDSRPDSRKESMFRRRRHCQTCGETYTTQEVLEAKEHLGPDARVMEMMFRKVLLEVAEEITAKFKEKLLE